MSKTIEAQSKVAESHRRVDGSHPRICSFGSDRRRRGRRGRHVPPTRCASLARMEADRTQQNRSQRPPLEPIQRRAHNDEEADRPASISANNPGTAPHP